MNISCPHCESRYLLPPALLGPGGARIRCPQCHQTFLVTAAGAVESPAGPMVNAASPADLGTGVPAASAPATPVPAGAAAPPGADAPAPAAPAADRTPAIPAGPSPVPRVRFEPWPPVIIAADPPEETSTPGPDDGSPLGVARRLLAEMDAQHGPDEIGFAAAHGTFFYAHGARLMEAWDEYKRRLGRDASSAAFREALRERWGVDLSPAGPPPR